MNKQNISSQEKETIDQTKQFLNLIQLNQQVSHRQQFQNKEGSLNIQNELEDINISINSEQTLKRKIKSQIVRKRIGSNRISQQVFCQVFNQLETQHAIISYQNQEDKNIFCQLSSKNQIDQAFQSQTKNYQPQEKTDILQQKEVQHQNKQLAPMHGHIADQQLNKQQLLKDEQAIEQTNVYQLENTEKKQNTTLQQDLQIYNEQQIIQQSNLFEKSSIQLQKNKKNLKNLQRIENQQEFVEQSSKIQNNNEYDIISYNDQQKQNTPQQEIQSTANQQQLGIIKNTQNMNNLFERYFSELIKRFDEIKVYQYTDYEIKNEIENIVQIKRQWNQQTFEIINCTQIQNDIFQSQKQKIIESLIQEQFYPCKIINSDRVKNLIIGFFYDGKDNFDEYENLNEYIFKIIHNQNQSKIDSYIEIFKTLGFQFEFIKIEKENISILILRKNFLSTSLQKFQQLLNFKQNILQIENNCEINSQNCKICTTCGNRKSCESYNCFKNIKSRILISKISVYSLEKGSTLGYYTYIYIQQSYCEYQNKLINGIIFQLSEEELIQEYSKFVQKPFINFLESDQTDQQNACEQHFDLVNEYSFRDYQSNQNQEQMKLSPNYEREWNINKFNSLNKNKVSNNFQSEDIFIGYQGEIKEKYSDYIFVIQYNPIDSETQKFLLIIKFQGHILNGVDLLFESIKMQEEIQQ
ncbi:hypothetical protein ABPG72_006874 [Tetrahymena utriculariae]